MEDKKIIELFWARNEDAIAETDATYGRKLRALANKILNNWEDAEESVSDTYMTFHKVDWKQAAKRNAEVVTLTEEMELCIPDTSRDREMEAREIGKALNAFLESLPKEARLIFLRRYWHVDTIAEIAARYGMTESKVKMQLSRTRAKLCTYLEQEGIQV
ncbi:MAG: hypothetical protein BHW31_00820 [Firmicutes bacterium CAG:110_56_8]|nr:MAG: hypothetical protein BHW31_00820 [Firmicutes bacterium CAG:110_56_8]